MTRHGRRIGALALVGAGLACSSITAITAAARPAAATPGAGVFLLGDSVTESLGIGSPSTFTATITPTYPDAVIDGRSNRRTVTASSYQGLPVTSGLDEIKANAGRIGDVIIVELGYNDCVAPGFPAAIDQILTELTRQDVPTVVWSMMTTLIRPEYASCNTALNDATKRWPTLRLADWDGYSHAHADWFANDGLGVHLTTTGRTAYATFLRDQLDELPGIGVRPPAAQHCASAVAIGRTVQSVAAGTPLAPSSGLFSARTPFARARHASGTTARCRARDRGADRRSVRRARQRERRGAERHRRSAVRRRLRHGVPVWRHAARRVEPQRHGRHYPTEPGARATRSERTGVSHHLDADRCDRRPVGLVLVRRPRPFPGPLAGSRPRHAPRHRARRSVA